MANELFISHAAITSATYLIERLRRVRYLRHKIIGRNADVRVSASALLRIPDGGRYVLVRNANRPELFGPFGGVYKFSESCRPILDEFLFRPQDVGPSRVMRDDLRGFIPGKKLPNFVNWFFKLTQRESATECMCRELAEEIKETKLDSALTVPKSLDLRKIRTVEEAPHRVPVETYKQFRIFEVYEAVIHNQESLTFFDKLVKLSQSHPDLLLADSHE